MTYPYTNIYHVFPRSFSSSHSLQEAIERANYMGFDMIYFNPFFRTGRSESIYSIFDYYDFDKFSFDSDTTPEQQIAALINACRANRMCPIIDLVINHTAIDSPLLQKHPAFYCREHGNVKLAAGRTPSETVTWYDLAQLDYENLQSGLWEYMLAVCKHYIQLGFRGFRCDAADQVPLPFWMWLIREVRRTDPDIIFIGEAYLCSLNTRIGLAYAGFDYIYNSAKWWDYQSDWLPNEYNTTCKYISSISFPDSHDTRRLMDEMGGDVKRFLQHLYFTAFWAQGFEIMAGTEFGAEEQLNCVTTRRSHPKRWKYDFTEHIKEVIKLRNLVFSNYPYKEIQTVICKDSRVEIVKAPGSLDRDSGKLMIALDFVDREVSIRKQFFDHYNKYTFNCIDPRPSFSAHPIHGDLQGER